MSMQQFAQQIEHLLWTGAIEGEEILKLYHSLKAYKQGLLTAEIMQEAIDQHDPDRLYVEPFLKENFLD